MRRPIPDFVATVVTIVAAFIVNVAPASASAGSPTPILTEPFTGTASTANAWFGAGACLTAGTTATPSSSLPACGTVAPQDAAGQGAVELTSPAKNQAGMIVYKTPLSTAGGLQLTFTDDAFNGTYSGGDGLVAFFTDASKPMPVAAGQVGGSLGYANAYTLPGIANAYLGVGFDEFGGFSNPASGLTGGPGRVRESIAVRGSAALGYPYLTGVTNASGVAASLPFNLDASTSTTRPTNAPTIQLTLTAAGQLTAAIDRHDGNGFVVYLSSQVVGRAAEPAVPGSVYIGFSAANGSNLNRHQLTNLTVTTLSAAPAPPALTEPPELHSQNGLLVFTLSAQADAAGNPQLNYNGSHVPPTLRLVPGDTLEVNVTNALPKPPAGVSYMNDVSLHYHGLHVTPNAPGDDSIDMIAAPGQTLHYQFLIPANQPPGLYWYHSHAHGETERQTLAGMSGAIVIDGIAQIVPQVAALPERILIVRDAPLPGQTLALGNALQTKTMQWSMRHGAALGPRTAMNHMRMEVRSSATSSARNPYVLVNPAFRQFRKPLAVSTHCSVNEAPVKALTINGQVQPAIALAPGEQQFWRVVNAGADTYLDLAIDRAQLQIVAIDGVAVSSGIGTPSVLTVNDYVLPPASRVEFIVTGPAAGTAAMVRTNCFDAGQSGNPMPAAVLASIAATTPAAAQARRNVAIRQARTHAVPRLPALRTVRAIKAQPIARTQTLYYSDQNTINGVAFDPGAPPMFYAQSGTVEEWTIVNNASQVHTFHIHQIHFVLEAINGATLAQQFVMDNVNVPAATAAGPGSVKILLDFTDPLDIGTFLLHCHILAHEDGGMMAKIRVGTAPPLTISNANVTFASATAAIQTVAISGGTAPYSVNGCAKVANAAVAGSTVTIAPVAAGACILTIADSSGLIGTINVTVQAAAAVMTVNPGTVSFAGVGSAAQQATLAGGKPPYTVAGCTGTASASIAGAIATIVPSAVGSCTLTFTDAAANTANLAVSVNAATGGGNPVDNLTFHHSAARTGWYNAESRLTPATVTSATFGLLATLKAPAGLPAFGKVYAQPLYVSAETVANGSQHNLVIVATSTDQIYAFDDVTRAVVWHRDFTNPSAGITQQSWLDTGCADVNPDVGITGTPVIDRAHDTLYVVVPTKENGNFHLRLHAVSLKSGAEAVDTTGRVVGPVEVTATYALATGGTASVSALNNFNRSALLEANGNIYIALGSHCDYGGKTTHGWMLGYSATTLQQTGNMLDLTNAGSYFLGAVWMSGFGPSADAAGNIYFATGNGPFNGVSNFAMSVLGLPGTLDITKATYFSPIGEAADSGADADLGSGGVIVLPDLPGPYPHVLVAGGKCGAGSAGGGTSGCVKYLLNRSSLGGQRAADSGALLQANIGGGMWGGPAAFQDASGKNYLVLGGGAPLATYGLSTAPLTLAVQSSANVGCLECRDAGSQPIVSSNGTVANTAIAWALKTPGGSGGTITLYAFDALNMGHTLFSGAAGGWTVGAGASGIAGALVSPVVANGNVYVPVDGGVAVFGLH